MKTQIALREKEDSLVTVEYDASEGVSGKYWVIHQNKFGHGHGISLIRTFDSETAWSDAERYTNDLLLKLGFNYTQTVTL
jgi:hypothetical protein